MPFKRYFWFYTLLMISLVNTFAQVGIGEWRTHLPYQFTNIVMLTDERAFCSSTGGLFYLDLTDNSVSTLSKTDGLSDNGVRAMEWNDENDLAILAYENANLDIIRGNGIINIPDILNKQIPGDKSINHIYFLENRAYLSCGFGIVVLDLQRFEISETYFIGNEGSQLKVNQVASDDIYLYAATNEGLKRAERSNPFLVDFNSWETMEGLPDPLAVYGGVEVFNGRVFTLWKDPAEVKDRIYYYTESWSEYTLYTDSICNEIRRAEDYLLFTGEDGVQVMSDDFIFIMSYEEGRPRSAVIDDGGNIWIADYGRGLVKVESNDEKVIVPNGPFSTIAYSIESSDGIVYTVSGGVTSSWANVYRAGILQQFNEEIWRSSVKFEYRDLVEMAIDPEDPGHVFAASWGYGVVEFQDRMVVNIYNETNSSLQNAVPGSDVVRIGGIAYDADGNLWMTNSLVTEPISVLKTDGTWKSFRCNDIFSGYSALGSIIITEDGHIWGILARGGGLFAINTNGTIENEDDDEYELVSVVDENGRVITNEVYSMAEDLNGNIWLGTDQGIFVYYSPGRLFSEGAIYAQDIIVPRNDGTIFGDPLLQTQRVTAIEVDGGNRKWLGTAGGGAFLVSENGLEQIYDFNTGNSPLLSNSITDISVEGKSGEVFFGTDQGIISFRGEATGGNETYSDVKVFPNPVREDYYGPIAIKGLLEETIVKITDISGNLVNELQSFGGQAIWDGTNFHGDRVATGTYLLFLANQDVTAAHVTKILFIH